MTGCSLQLISLFCCILPHCDCTLLKTQSKRSSISPILQSYLVMELKMYPFIYLSMFAVSIEVNESILCSSVGEGCIDWPFIFSVTNLTRKENAVYFLLGEKNKYENKRVNIFSPCIFFNVLST